MKHEDKIKFMQEWCQKQKLTLVLEGEVGFGRQCVGVLSEQCGAYPDYIIFDEDYNIVDGNEVWTPEDAYHKHPCVAVLGVGEEAESQLYEWVKWFDNNNYVCVVEKQDTTGWTDIDFIFEQEYKCKMVKQ